MTLPMVAYEEAVHKRSRILAFHIKGILAGGQ